MPPTSDMSTCRIGITGTIGSGKSLVGKILSEHDVPILDVDDVVHILLDTDKSVQRQIRKSFGGEYLTPKSDGGERVDRGRLGKLVFADESHRRTLEKIVHPAVLDYSEKWIQEQQAPIAAVLIPLLFEAGKPGNFHQVWSVICSEPTLRQRLKERSKLSDQDIDKRLAAQLPQEEKATRADCVIDNSGTIEETRTQIASLLIEIQQTIGLPTIDSRLLVSTSAEKETGTH